VVGLDVYNEDKQNIGIVLGVDVLAAGSRASIAVEASVQSGGQ